MRFGADRGVILLREQKTERWRPLAVKTDRPGIAISRTLVNRAVAERRPLLFHDALGEVSFVGARSIMPMNGIPNCVGGMLAAVSSRSSLPSPGNWDKWLASA